MSKSEKISWLIVIGLVVVLFLSLWNGRKVETIEIKTTDTIIVYKYDTIVEYKTRYITERVLDTIFLPSQNTPSKTPSTPLLITQRHYSKPNLYDLWISGYKPTVDSIKVYQKTEYQTITNEITKEIYPKYWRMYLGVGFQAVSDTFIPTVGITLTTPDKWAITANLGYYNKDLFYGAQIQYKLFENSKKYGKENRRELD